MDNSVKLLREANVDSENRLRMSQLLDGVLQKIEDISNRIIGVKLMTVIEQGTYKIVEDILNRYFQMGCQGTSLFYEKNTVYEKLKSRSYGICCVCGLKTFIPERLNELRDAVAYKELLVVEESELAVWKSLRNDEDDWRGALA